MNLKKKNIQDRHISRRQFLVGAGSAFLALPPLLSLMSNEAAAASIAAQKKVRSVVYVGYLGIDEFQLVPATMDPSALLTYGGGVQTRYRALNTMPAPFSRMIDASFAPMYPHMNVIRGLSLAGGYYQGHNNSILSGSHSGFREPIYGKSMDVILEQSSSVYNSDFVGQKAIRIDGASMCFDRVNGARISMGNTVGDAQLFNQLFGGMNAAITTDTALINQRKTNVKLVVDRVQEDLKKLEANPQLSKEDKLTVDRFISSFQDVQKKVIANSSGTGPICSVPTIKFEASATGNKYNFPLNWGINSVGVMYENYIEMIRLAFACDLTRVVYIQNSLWNDVPTSPTSAGGLHHECASSELAADRQQWGLKKMLKLAEALQSTSDPQGGTLLDNSSILFTNELGAWTTAHNTMSLPAVLFGSGGGQIRTGNYVDYTQVGIKKSSIGNPGRPYKQLLQTIMQSMGVPKSEYMLYGDGNGFGEFVEGINQFGHKTTDTFTPYKNEHNDTLPLIKI